MDTMENITKNKIQKGTILLRKGDVCNYGYKIISGCLKSYVIDNAEKEHIIQFAPENWIISDLDSLLNKKPSSIFIEAVEDTEYVKFSNADFKDFAYANNYALMEQEHLKIIRNMISLNKRIIALLSATAEERYLEFVETYPTIVQRLPLKLIASYIGITPEYLSEIRRKIAKK
jgi:CRP-like cAMP-binding protein